MRTPHPLAPCYDWDVEERPLPSQAPYISEYMATFARTESFGLKAPLRLLLAKNCVDVDKTFPVLLDYFNAHEPEELLGQTLATEAIRVAACGRRASCLTLCATRR